MSFNPYASEDFNRIKVKSEKDYETQKKEKLESSKTIDHPLIEGKKIEMSHNELKNFTNAMGQGEFRNILNDYVDEISDPAHKPEMQQYLKQMEAQGDLPPGTILIQPTVGFCVKTSCKKLVSEKNKSYFDQKCFINICFHEKVPKAEKNEVVGKDGKKGYNWSLPYRVSQLRHDQDNSKSLCSTYDVVFNDEIQSYLAYPEFQKFVADTAIDGVGRVLAENKEKISTDYKILKNIKCKGGEPSMMTVKIESSNPLLNNIDISKTETKLQKEIMKVKSDQMEKETKEQENARRLKEAQNRFDNNEEDEVDEEGIQVETKPDGIIQPKYKIVHTYPTDMLDSWAGFETSQMAHEKEIRKKIPTHITVTIELKWIDSIKLAKLEINEQTILFEYPDQYYLDIDLKYKCDPNQGNAKFDKQKHLLTIRLPVIGLTPESQKVLDQHYQKYVIEQQERLSKLELQGQVKQELQNEQSTESQSQDQNISEEERRIASQYKQALKSLSSQNGVGKSKIFNGKTVGGDDSQINDQYNLEQDTEQLKKQMMSEFDEDDDIDDPSGFLKIYKEQNNQDELQDQEKDVSDIKFKNEINDSEANEDEIHSSSKIQEISSTVFTNHQHKQQKFQNKIENQQEMIFDWEKAERVDAKFQFINQGDLIFVTYNFKGYKKDQDVRYALSDNEILLEVRDLGKNKVHRTCKTLFKQVSVQDSEVQLLVDYIVFKMKKSSQFSKDDLKVTWNELGYDIQSFSIPKSKDNLKSNIFKVHEQPEERKSIENKENSSKNSNSSKIQQSDLTTQDSQTEKDYNIEEQIVPKSQKEQEEELTEDQKLELAKKREDEAIEKIIEKQKTTRQMSFLNLKSDVFEIY